MSFGDHLDELRRRLILGLLGVVAAAGVALYFGQDIIAWLQAPLNHVQRQAGLPAMTVAPSVTTGFSIYLKVSLVTGLVVGSPILIYQLWKFVSAGLYEQEKKLVVILMPFSVLMTTLGVLFTYFIMLPICLAFLISFTTSYPTAGEVRPDFVERVTSALTWWAQTPGAPPPPPERPPGVSPQAPELAPAPPGSVVVPSLSADPAKPADGQIWINAAEREVKIFYQGRTRTITLATGSLITPLLSIDEYINFVALTTLGVVIAFQLPLIMMVVGWTGVLPPELVSRHRKHCVFVCFVLGAVLTPADVVSMMVLSFPLWGLFELGLLLMRKTYRRREPVW